MAKLAQRWKWLMYVRHFKCLSPVFSHRPSLETRSRALPSVPAYDPLSRWVPSWLLFRPYVCNNSNYIMTQQSQKMGVSECQLYWCRFQTQARWESSASPKHWWFSGRITASRAGDLGLFPRQCQEVLLLSFQLVVPILPTMMEVVTFYWTVKAGCTQTEEVCQKMVL